MKYVVAFAQQLMLVVLSAFLMACGGSGGGSSNTSESSHQTSESAQPKSLSGTAIKGLIINGEVEVYGIRNGAKNAMLATTTTDNNGNYSLTIPGDYNGPILVEIKAKSDGSSQMMCDSATGCGNFIGLTELDSNQNGQIDFGELFPLDQNFQLNALVPNSVAQQANFSVDVTLITHLAAAYAASFPQGYDNLSAELSITQIANIFSIAENPLTLNTPSINDIESFNRAGTEEKIYALIASSLANVVTADLLSETIEALSDRFSVQSGQLVIKSESAETVTLLSLLEAAQANLNKLTEDNTELDFSGLQNQINTLVNGANGAENDSLTAGEGSPTSGSSELSKVAQFVNDLQYWQGVIAVSGADQEILFAGEDTALSLNYFQTPALQALALASQHSAIVAVPDLALDAACDSLGNFLLVLLCDSLVGSKSIEEICEVALNLSIFGVSLCDFLNDLTLPMGHGLWANYAIYDRTARIYGTLEGVTLDIEFSNAKRTRREIRFNVTGSVTSESAEILINSGNIRFLFDGGLSSNSLRLPEEVILKVDVVSNTATDSGSIGFTGEININAELDNITGSEQTGLEGINYSVNTDGEYLLANGQALSGKLTFTNDDNYAAQLAIQPADMTTTALLTFSSLDDFKLSWDGKQYSFSYDPQAPDLLTVSNQDNVSMSLDISLEDQPQVGEIAIGTAIYAEIEALNGSHIIRMPDNSEVLLYQ
ncbi:MAG: hypothetical protein MI976_10295 [Pseudomonadales bacterium]|nr:hypothetical protein [Pseudomonadales bacterium]